GAPLEHPGPVWAVALGPDGQTALTGCEDGTARLWSLVFQEKWNTSTGRPSIPRFPLPLEHPGPVWAVAVALGPDGQIALTGCEDGTARLWDLATGQPKTLNHQPKTLNHGGSIRAVALTPDGKVALTGSHDRTAWLWNLAKCE